MLIAALAFAAWGDPDNESQPPLSFDDGIGAVAIFGGIGAVLVFGAAASFAATRRWWGALMTTLLIGLAGIVGFL